MPFDDTSLRVTSPEIELLDDVAQILSSETKWCKGRGQSQDGRRHCIVGAIWQTRRPIFQKNKVENAMQQVLTMNGQGFSVTGFNDIVTTHHKDVLALIARTREVFVQRALKKESSHAV